MRTRAGPPSIAILRGVEGTTGADGLLAQLTLEEKAALTVGRDAWTTVAVERLGIPPVWLSDGPTGLRKLVSSEDLSLTNTLPATCFPTESSLAASWDVALVEEVAGAIAAECRAEGVGVLLGPGINLKRSPLGGRNFEYFSEDPVLSGRMAAAFVRGVQARGVGACLKHLVANEHETGRMYADSIVDERTLREVYLRPFEIAVREADPWTVMASYNRLNGDYCVESRRLLREILVEEWGFSGIVMSDWLAVNDRVASIAAGLHLQMPGSPTAPAVVAAVREGRLDEARLDELVRELLVLVERASAAAAEPAAAPDLDAHHRLARRAAAEGMVLLKNDGPLLPLAEAGDGVALIGAFAREPRFQGAGSSQVRPTRIETLHEELPHGAYAPGYPADGSPDPDLLRAAQEAARGARVTIVCVGLPESHETEGVDRQHIDLPAQHTALVEAVLDVQPNTVVVLINGSAVAMPWAARAARDRRGVARRPGRRRRDRRRPARPRQPLGAAGGDVPGRARRHSRAPRLPRRRRRPQPLHRPPLHGLPVLRRARRSSRCSRSATACPTRASSTPACGSTGWTSR